MIVANLPKVVPKLPEVVLKLPEVVLKLPKVVLKLSEKSPKIYNIVLKLVKGCCLCELPDNMPCSALPACLL